MAITPCTNPTDSKLTATDFQNAFSQLWTKGAQLSIIGQADMTWTMVIALLSGEHALLTGEPGTGKSYTAEVMGKLAFGSQRDYYGRVQGTPDKQPSSLNGGLVYNPASGKLEVRQGPLLRYNVAHIDEINRMPPKSQSALLEAMMERSVEIDGVVYGTRPGFTVFGTMNRASEGTYEVLDPLVDRFAFSARTLLPDAAARALIRSMRFRQLKDVRPVFGSLDEYLEMVAYARECASAPSNAANDYITQVVDTFRKPDSWFKVPRGQDGEYEPTVGVRAEMALLLGSTVAALSEGRVEATPLDIQRVTGAVLGHRLSIKPDAKNGGNVRSLIADTLRDSGLWINTKEG